MIALDISKSKIPGQNIFEVYGKILWLAVRRRRRNTERNY